MLRSLAFHFVVLFAATFFAAINVQATLGEDTPPPAKLKALIIDGQNNHIMWPKTTMMIKRYLERTGRFDVDVERTRFTWKGGDLVKQYPLNDGKSYEDLPQPKSDPDFHPDFKNYDVVVSNFGWKPAAWPESTKRDFIDYVAGGGGLVIVHAADNSFGDWREFNQMIGLGGWDGRNEKSGPYVYLNDDGQTVRDESPGGGGDHGPQHEYPIIVRTPDHPITRGLPRMWMHATDELYQKLRGPATNMTILATAYSDPKYKGTDRHEPMLMTIDYGKGRVFHTPMGHDDKSMECVGFITSLVRGTEWAATGEVTINEIPEDFPSETEVSRREFASVDRPNVVLVLCDDIRWDALSCAGHPHLKTPNIDQLAAEGLYFENMFCTTSLCSPSRASILSGLYAHAHGITNNFTDYPDDLASFPRTLQGSGYQTAYIGKWHMGEDDDNPRPGFDHFITHRGQGKYFDTEFNTNGQGAKVVEGYYTTVVTDMAIDWMKQQSTGEEPFLLMLGQKAPHSFYFPEPKYEDAFDHVEVNYPHSAFHLTDKPQWITQRLNTWHGIYGPLFDWRKQFPNDKAEAVVDFAAMVRAYWGTILSVDDSVGRLVATLKEMGQFDNTMFIFMGDNGLLEGEHGMVDKRTAHEPSMRVPMIIRYPGLTPDGPKRVAEQVLTTDVAPTVLDVCQAPRLDNIYGRSIVPMVTGRSNDWRNGCLYYYNYEKQFPYTPNVRALRTDRWKYIRYPTGDGSPDVHMAELYDLLNDPGETTNLIARPENEALIASLKVQMTEVMNELGLQDDPMPIDQGIGTELPDQAIR